MPEKKQSGFVTNDFIVAFKDDTNFFGQGLLAVSGL